MNTIDDIRDPQPPSDRHMEGNPLHREEDTEVKVHTWRREYGALVMVHFKTEDEARDFAEEMIERYYHRIKNKLRDME